MDECGTYKKLLSEYVDGALEGDTWEAVKTHLSLCEACSKEVASLKSLSGELRNMEPVTAPSDFLPRLRSRIDSAPRTERILEKLFFPLRWKLPVNVVAAGVLGVLVFSLVSLEMEDQEDVLYAPMTSGKAHVKEEAVLKSQEAPADVAAGPSPQEERKELRMLQDRASPPPAPARERAKKRVARVTAMRGEAPAGAPAGERIGMQHAESMLGAAPEEPMAYSEREAPIVLQVSTGSGARLPATQAADEIAALVTRVGGEVTAVEHENGTGIPRAVSASVPSARYKEFCETLAAEFSLTTSPLCEQRPSIGNVLVRVEFCAP